MRILGRHAVTKLPRENRCAVRRGGLVEMDLADQVGLRGDSSRNRVFDGTRDSAADVLRVEQVGVLRRGTMC
jgi:hypothetical protein